jgi:hypothetical protein
LLPLDLQDVDESTLQKLCATRCGESATLDFKRDVPGTSDRDKHEFLKDVCAMANADGGDLVYGVAEVDGVAESLVPLTSESADEVQRRLSQVLDAGLEPRVHGIKLRAVPCGVGLCLVVRVPASFAGPHRYLFNQHSKFVMRNGTHNSELSYQQLRAAFDRTATLTERAMEFVERRVAAIKARTTGRPLEPGPVCVVHVVPIASMARTTSVDIAKLRSDLGRWMFDDWGGCSASLNLDGLVAYPGGTAIGEAHPAYTQVFRHGAMESARTGHNPFAPDNKPSIPSTTVTAFFRDALAKLLGAMRSEGIAGPGIARLALLDVSAYEFGVGTRYWSRAPAFSDRPDLVLPEVWIDDLSVPRNVDELCRPLMDILWQSFGVDRCLEYTPEGAWQPRR